MKVGDLVTIKNDDVFIGIIVEIFNEGFDVCWIVPMFFLDHDYQILKEKT